ncbi:MAG TPA: hypothetical protein VF702_02530 [Allosphingosinicella sp.]|jgi:hypothetical protein
MIYEARHSQPLYFGLAAACALLSILGFAAAGVIPTASGSAPLIGWAIVLACFAAAAVFVRRALDRRPQVRLDADGVYVRAVSERTIGWDEIVGFQPLALGIQRIVRFELRDPAALGPGARVGSGRGVLSYGHFGVNTTFYDRGMRELLTILSRHRPDFA